MKYDALITHALELIAALAGFYYLRHNVNSKLRKLVYFLVRGIRMLFTIHRSPIIHNF